MSNLFTILSPAKTLDMNGGHGLTFKSSQPRHKAKTLKLAAEMLKYTPKKIEKLMSISNKLAIQNSERWKSFGTKSNPKGAAAMCFRGDVFQGLEAWTMTKESINWAQKHVRILSGLYGVLRPLDSIQPYRLEMGTRLKIDTSKNLYEYWGNSLMKTILSDMKSSGATTLVNLASDEYSKAVGLQDINIPVINVKFLQNEKKTNKFISFYAKKARGFMARWMADNNPKTIKDLSKFNTEGYKLDKHLSSSNLLIYTRPRPSAIKSAS